MYAIVEIAGKQYKVEKDITIEVDKLDRQENEDFDIDKVILFANGDDVQVGQPYLAGVKVKVQFIKNIKSKKVRGVKFKKRKNYTRTLGHRQNYSQLKIKDLVVS
ncbi:MAG: 50S ribosomal protein L21 [Spirochaetae bacterium HGW-Spirochaetae-1]|jgi:large subunit ribosomal protein L21|nr:MAG: 50S ribosomal protein L21 [Spirochaetae bacterium HGW-Spirochaetae-1]